MKKMKNPCWKGYQAIGTKMKNGKEVPNCVPIKEQVEEKISLMTFKDFLSWVKNSYKNNPEPKIDDLHRKDPMGTTEAGEKKPHSVAQERDIRYEE